MSGWGCLPCLGGHPFRCAPSVSSLVLVQFKCILVWKAPSHFSMSCSLGTRRSRLPQHSSGAKILTLSATPRSVGTRLLPWCDHAGTLRSSGGCWSLSMPPLLWGPSRITSTPGAPCFQSPQSYWAPLSASPAPGTGHHTLSQTHTGVSAPLAFSKYEIKISSKVN